MAVFAVLAAMGLFSVISRAVSDRTAKPRLVCRLIVGQGMTLALVGLLVGLPRALGMGRAISGLLYGVSPDDFATFADVAVILAGASHGRLRYE